MEAVERAPCQQTQEGTSQRDVAGHEGAEEHANVLKETCPQGTRLDKSPRKTQAGKVTAYITEARSPSPRQLGTARQRGMFSVGPAPTAGDLEGSPGPWKAGQREEKGLDEEPTAARLRDIPPWGESPSRPTLPLDPFPVGPENACWGCRWLQHLTQDNARTTALTSHPKLATNSLAALIICTSL